MFFSHYFYSQKLHVPVKDGADRGDAAQPPFVDDDGDFVFGHQVSRLYCGPHCVHSPGSCFIRRLHKQTLKNYYLRQPIVSLH